MDGWTNARIHWQPIIFRHCYQKYLSQATWEIFQLILNSKQPTSMSCIHFRKTETAQQSCHHRASPTMFYTCASCIFTKYFSMSLSASLALTFKYEGFRSSLSCWVYFQVSLQKKPQYLKNNHVCRIDPRGIKLPGIPQLPQDMSKICRYVPLQECTCTLPRVHIVMNSWHYHRMCTFVDTYHTPHRTFLGTHATGCV